VNINKRKRQNLFYNALIALGAFLIITSEWISIVVVVVIGLFILAQLIIIFTMNTNERIKQSGRVSTVYVDPEILNESTLSVFLDPPGPLELK
jgi:hypothetical protein